MLQIKKYIKSISNRINPHGENDPPMNFIWKIIIYLFIVIFSVLIVGGWVFYIWIVSDSVSIPSAKPVKTQITQEQIKRAGEIANEKSGNLEKVINSEFDIPSLK